MALKLEHKCTRCNRATSTEVSNVAAATASEELEAKRAATLSNISKYMAGIAPELLPDLFIVRRGSEPVVQTYLCADEDAKRSCADRVAFIVEECKTFDPRKPKTKKPKDAPAPAPVAETKSEKKNDKSNAAAAKQ
jgi:hypothetical protein